MSDFESNIRSVERAVRSLPDGLIGWVRLVENGIQIHIVGPQDKAVNHVIQWHELASWASPIGDLIVRIMIDRLSAPKPTMRNP